MASMKSLVYADVDGDGDDDVLGVTFASNVLLLLNNGSGFFVNATASSGVGVAVNRVVAVSVGDIDGDGDLDVIVSATASPYIVMENNGSGRFADATAARLIPGAAIASAAPTMVDVDGDGDLDLFAPGSSGNRLYVNVGNGTLVDAGSNRGVASYSGGGVVRGSTAADVDGDGDVDVLVFGSGPQQLYANNGSGWFVDIAASALALEVNATSASFGDVDNDGDVDVLMSSSASLGVVAVNGGRGDFTVAAMTLGDVGSAAPVFVDIDSDGDVDVPAVGFVSGVVSPGVVGVGVATVRVLSRSGRRVCHGATVVVRRSSDGSVAASRIVSAGTAPYDVYIASPFAGPLDVEVSFPSGRCHSKQTQVALSALQLSTVSSMSVPLLVARDTPGIVSASLSPSSGVYGPGSTLTAIVRSLGGEPGLSAAASCFMNEVNVSSSMVDWRNGTYTFSYVVQASHRSSAGVPASLQLLDARWSLPSDVMSIVLGAGMVHVDTTAPLVSFVATPNCSRHRRVTE
jgi:hypothetical protein